MQLHLFVCMVGGSASQRVWVDTGGVAEAGPELGDAQKGAAAAQLGWLAAMESHGEHIWCCENRCEVRTMVGDGWRVLLPTALELLRHDAYCKRKRRWVRAHHGGVRPDLDGKNRGKVGTS
jgi:hypothetical protein